MSKAKTKAADLRQPPPNKAKDTSRLAPWFSAHPEALARVDEWLELRAKGQSTWTAADIYAEMTEIYGPLPCTLGRFRDWLDRHRTAIYRRGEL